MCVLSSKLFFGFEIGGLNMQYIKITKIIITFLTISVIACSCTREKGSNPDINVPDYGKPQAIENREGRSNIYKAGKKSISKMENVSLVSELAYDAQNKTLVYLETKSNGINLVNNVIKIITPSKEKILDKFYSASDIKLSPDGNKIACRLYKKDSYDSAEGLKVYDIKSNKYVDMHTDVLVSGSLYEWKNDDEVLYYGIKSKSNGKIYSYNIKKGSESIYFDDINGICMFFLPFDGDLVYYEKNGDNMTLCYKTGEKKYVISRNFSDIYEGISDGLNTIYFIASEKDSKKVSLYGFSSDSKELKKITYDFPYSVDECGGIGADKSGNIYFCGFSTGEINKNDIYCYDAHSKSINIISSHSGNYKIFN